MPKAKTPMPQRQKMSVVPTTPCACCGAASLTFSDNADPAIRAIANLCSPRWECSCWKVVQCQRCKPQCIGHCGCIQRQMATKIRVDGNVAGRRAEHMRHPDPELPLAMAWKAKEKR